MSSKFQALAGVLAFAFTISCAGEDGPLGTEVQEAQSLAPAEQPAPAVHPGATEHAARLQAAIALSDEQTSDVEAIFAASELSWPERGDRIRALLTGEQLPAFEALLAAHGCREGECSGPHGRQPSDEACDGDGDGDGAGCGDRASCGGGSRHGGLDDDGVRDHTARLQERLQLTDAQTAQVEAIFADRSLDYEQRAEQIRGLLTDEQATELDALRASHHQRGWRRPE